MAGKLPFHLPRRRAEESGFQSLEPFFQRFEKNGANVSMVANSREYFQGLKHASGVFRRACRALSTLSKHWNPYRPEQVRSSGGEVHVGAVIGEFGGGGDDVVNGIVLTQAAQVGFRKIFFDGFGVVFGKFRPFG